MNTTAKEILEFFYNHGYNAYVVGGYVRDFLMHKKSNDIDICTNATKNEILSLFSRNINEYNSFHIKKNGFNIDITPFRREENYQDRRPTKIIYTKNLKTDLLRRDFTINTICMDKDENIIDLLGGQKDLKNKQIKMVGDIKIKIKEDPLRILRAIRIATELDFEIEKNLEQEIILNKNFVNTLSSYRIKEEVSKILTSKNYQKGLKYIKKFHMCSDLGISFTNVYYTNDLCGMWAQMKWKRNLPFTKIEKENIVKIREILNLKVIHREVLYKYGLYLSLISATILGIDKDFIHKMYNSLPISTRKDLKISYLEICEILQVKPAKKVKEIENKLVEEVLNERIVNEKKALELFLIENKTRWLL